MPLQTGSPYSCKTANAKRTRKACDQKDENEAARISVHCFVDKSVNLKGLSGLALATAILTAEAACKAYIIRESSGAYDGGEDVVGKAGGRQTERVTNTKHGITGTDPEYVGNETFWSTMRAAQNTYNYVGVTASRAWPVLGQSLAIAGKGPISDDPTASIEGEFTVGWNKFAPLVSVPIDVAALDAAPFLPFVSLTNAVGSGATLTQTADLETITVAAGEDVEVTALFTGAVSYGIRSEDGEPLDIEASIDQATGVLSYAADVAGEGRHLLFIRGENACGVFGEVQVAIVVTP